MQRAARKGLTSLYRDLRPDKNKLAAHQQRITRLRIQARPSQTKIAPAEKPVAERLVSSAPVPAASFAAESVVTIVSGLPRSGTSMMMQILVAGGIVPYTDGQRLPDIDNPHGYFEHEQATRLASDTRWLPDARGQVVKIVAPLLPRLPSTEHYRIVLMHRGIGEVLRSQRAMLQRLGRAGGALTDDQLAASLTQQMEQVTQWCAAQPNVRALHLDYRDVLTHPEPTCRQIAAFLGRPLDVVSMQKAIDPALHRQSPLTDRNYQPSSLSGLCGSLVVSPNDDDPIQNRRCRAPAHPEAASHRERTLRCLRYHRGKNAAATRPPRHLPARVGFSGKHDDWQ